MKLMQFMAHLAIILRVPLSGLFQLLLALRQGSSKLALEERRLMKAAKSPVSWCAVSFTDVLQGEGGRYGGVKITPQVLAYFLTGFLVDSARIRVAAKTLELMFAPAAARSLAVPSPLTPLDICPVTKQRYWGGALVAVLSDPALLRETYELHVCADRNLAILEFTDGTMTHFTRSPLDKTSWYSMHNLPLDILSPLLLEVINQEESSAA